MHGRTKLQGIIFAAALCLLAPVAGAAPQLYSIGNPTGEEQLYLEYINRARANPNAEAARLVASRDPDLLAALSAITVDLNLFIAQMNALPAVPPLAFNAKLMATARAHSQEMFAFAYQEHVGRDGSTPASRLLVAGYLWTAYGENIYSFAKSVFYGHAAFEIDWGGSAASGWMQNPPGHRQIIHTAYLREIGVGVVDGSNGNVGPQIVTEDFGLSAEGNHPFLTGVVYADANGNGFYDPGEGVSGVKVSVKEADFYAVTAAAGGYAVPLPNDGTYTVTFSGGGLPTASKVASVQRSENVKVDYAAPMASPPPSPSQLANLATRLTVGRGEDALIGGFILTGSAPKKILLRAIGPSLGMAGALTDPTLELHDSTGKIVASNDNWQTNSNQQAIVQSAVAPTDARESAILTTLPAQGSSYTAIVRGKNNATGIGLVEIYDLDRAADAQLANLSTRGRVQTGDNVMIGGLVISGSAPTKVIVRALGPSLPVAGKLADPTLALVDGNGVTLQTNDNWRSDQAAAISATTVAPQDDAEAAIVRTLPPGAYTAVVRGAHEQTGVAVVEVYNLP